MRNLLRFLVNNQFILLFLLLETIAITLVVKNNNYQGAQYNQLSYVINGYLSQKKNSFFQYLSLSDVNGELADENARLKNELERLRMIKEVSFVDTLRQEHFGYISARVVYNSVNKQYNYIILNKGANSGIKPDMAVICPDGVVGIIQSVSENYSSVISMLNRNIKVSSKFKKNSYFGSFEWSGVNYRTGDLKEIPLHVDLKKGDTIITSGFSAIFPEGISVGYVKEFDVKGGNFFDITVELSTDFKNLSYVYVINNNYKKEFQELLNKTEK